MSVLKQAIAEAQDIAQEKLFVPEWGVELGVRSMDGNARANLIENSADENGRMQFRAMYPELIINCVFDPSTGEPVFEDTDADRALLLSKSGGALEKVARKAMELSGLDEKSEEKVGKSSSEAVKPASTSN